MNRIMRRTALVAAAAIAAGVALAPIVASGAPHGSDGGWGEASSVANINAPEGDGCPIESPDGQSIVVADESQMTELAEALKADQLEAYIAEHPEG